LESWGVGSNGLDVLGTFGAYVVISTTPYHTKFNPEAD